MDGQQSRAQALPSDAAPDKGFLLVSPAWRHLSMGTACHLEVCLWYVCTHTCILSLGAQTPLFCYRGLCPLASTSQRKGWGP